MPIDWAATGAMLSGAGTLLGAVAVVTAATTFDSGRKQEVERRRLSQAERILEATYRAQMALSYVRSTIHGPELRDSPELSAATEVVQKETIAQAYRARLNEANRQQDELVPLLPMAKALFGKELEDCDPVAPQPI